MAKKLQFASDLYLGAGICSDNNRMNVNKLDKLKKKIAKKPLFANVYVLTLAQNPENQLEIYHARQLAQSYYIQYPPYIVGIAATYSEAVALLEQIVQECLQARGDCCLKEFLLC